MPGMGKVLQANNPVMVAAFRTTLDHQLLIIVGLAVVLALAWNITRTIQYRHAVASGTIGTKSAAPLLPPEPLARRVLRISFGVLWLFDGLLQAQSAMPVGLPGQVLTPAASSSPGWVQHLVNVGATIWSDHPITAAAASVWIQIGIGAFLLVAPRGYWSRAAGVVSVGWGLVVWVFGEAFGGILSQGNSFLFGFPGSVLLYVVAGALVALPESSWATERLGKGILRCTGAFFVAMAIYQAWPGRGFWAGQTPSSSATGPLTSMIHQMAQTSQPTWLASWLRSFGSFDATHGWAVNLAVVILLAAIGACFLSADGRLVRIGVVVGAVVCVADWVLVQDLGFLGGVGTDPNSMIPMVLLFSAGYLGIVRVPAEEAAVSPAAPADPAPAEATGVALSGGGGSDAGSSAGGDPLPAPAGSSGGSFVDRLSPSYLVRVLAAAGAVGVVLVGAAPMALAATNPTADAIVTEASNGSPNLVDLPAAPFGLTNQAGRQVSLNSFAGHTVLLTFLDPVCTSDCPLIAQEFRLVDQMLGSEASRVDLVAVVANPVYNTTAATNAFDRQEGLQSVPNWSYLTGSVSNLESVWQNYGVEALVEPAGAMVDHSEIVYLIDGHGRTREIFNADPGAGTTSTQSSFSALLVSQVQRFTHS